MYNTCELVASGLRQKTAKSLVVRESPEAVYTKVVIERHNWPREKNSGMVKVKRIGQSACSSPNPAMAGNGEASETERRLVCDKELSQLQHAYDTVRPLGKPSWTNRWVVWL